MYNLQKGYTMASELIKLNDGLFVEIDKAGEQIEDISGGNASVVDSSMQKLTDFIKASLSPIF